MKVDEPGWKVGVDVPTDIKVEQPTWSVKVDDSYKVKVDEPTWKVGVDVPTGIIDVKIDVDSAATRLSSAITSALDKPIKVEYTGEVKAVGGEKLDKLTELVSRVNDKLLNVKSNLEDKINVISNNNDSSQIDRRIDEIVQIQMTNIEAQIADNRTDVSASRSEIIRVEMRLGAMLSELDSRFRITQNFALV